MAAVLTFSSWKLPCKFLLTVSRGFPWLPSFLALLPVCDCLLGFNLSEVSDWPVFNVAELLPVCSWLLCCLMEESVCVCTRCSAVLLSAWWVKLDWKLIVDFDCIGENSGDVGCWCMEDKDSRGKAELLTCNNINNCRSIPRMHVHTLLVSTRGWLGILFSNCKVRTTSLHAWSWPLQLGLPFEHIASTLLVVSHETEVSLQSYPTGMHCIKKSTRGSIWDIFWHVYKHRCPQLNSVYSS